MTDPDFRVVDVRFEHLPTALGIGVSSPRLSWRVETNSPGWMQRACELELLDDRGGRLAGTGLIETTECVLVEWPFEPLASREVRQVRVRVWGERSDAGAWSEPAVVEAGLLSPDDWSAHFITPDWDEDASLPQPCPWLRNEFDLRAPVRRARLYVTALGVYWAEINGRRVSEDLFAPGWTSYDHRLRYQTYDVTNLVQSGRNALGAVVGEGWFRGRLGYHMGRRNIYGDRAGLIAQLEVEYEDGTRERIVSDESWRASLGPIISSELYDGETYDARLVLHGWSEVGFDDAGWTRCRLLDRGVDTFVAPTGPAVRATGEVPPVAIFQSPSGRTLVDFGQNLVGRVRIQVSGPAGHTVTLRHAEVLENGELGVRPLRYAAATERYTLCGEGVEVWEPAFTFHGFRYAEVENWPGELTPEALHAVVLQSDLERTGWFECSNPLVNRLHENVVWSMRGNFVDVPTDCPQRDERLGWTGDIQVFAPTAAFLFDVDGFLQSWLADLTAEQAASAGIVPYFVPNVMDPPPSPAAAWGDAAVVVPWVLYQRYGDTGMLAQQYDSMKTWVDLIARVAGPSRLWEQGIQFGDWVDPKAAPERPGDARTAPWVVATAYFARSAELLANAAAVLGRTDDALAYRNLADEVRRAFVHHYVTPAGRLLSDAPTAYALALEFALLPTPEARAAAGNRLAELVRGSGYHVTTGFVGTPLVCDALCDAGHHDTAYRLLLQTTCPSWLYPVTMGATTIWERWDSLLPDGTVNPGEMTSFNHYALGAVADWLHRVVAGLAPGAPGYRRITVRPHPGGGFTHASASHMTPYGLARCSWRTGDGAIALDVQAPPNTVVDVYLPGSEDTPITVGSGAHSWTRAWQPPIVVAPPLTLDSPLGDLYDHPTAWARIHPIFAAHNPEFIYRMDGQTAVTLREAILQNPRSQVLREEVEAALQEAQKES